MKSMLQVILVLVLSLAFAPELRAQPPVESSIGTPPSVPENGSPTSFNPAIGVNFLGLLQGGKGLSDDPAAIPRKGLRFQEAELQFSSDVDPYFRAVGLFSIRQEDGSGEFSIEPEEVFAETLSIPSVTIRAGQLKAALGKHNQLHTHAYPFIDAPLAQQALLGAEGLNEMGFSAAVLLPVSWYSEVIVQALTARNDVFASSRSGDPAILGRLKNLWDVSDDLTLEAGISGVRGPEGDGGREGLLEADLTLKWRPSVLGKYRSVTWSTEFLQSRHESGRNLGGLASWVQWQVAQRWWVQARVERFGIPEPENIDPVNKLSALVGFFPSEFSGLRAQYDRISPEGADEPEHAFSLQYNISIGAHPAHAY